MISVIIPTVDRTQKLALCLKSLKKNRFRNYEIIIADQNTNQATKQMLKELSSLPIRYFHLSFRGKSQALNQVLSKAKGEILAFTDDDCIVDKNWLKNISSVFKNREIAGLLGVVLPYQPELHPNESCPSVTMHRKRLVYNHSNFRFEYLGLGNNMAFRKEIIDKIGPFKYWLGVGATAKSGIETEYIYRVIYQGFNILIEPNVITYHNRWLKDTEAQQKQNMYACGYFSFCSYYLFKGDLKAISLMNEKLKRRFFRRFVNIIRKRTFINLIYMVWEIPYYLLGIILGFYFRFFE